MKSYSPEPLTPEERELARLTGHLGPQGEPSTALDARILAAAHAALDRKQPSRRKPRWPVAMGLAASVIFAVGIAWQLRPLQQAPMAASEAPAVASAAIEHEPMADGSAAAAAGSSPVPQANVAADMASADAAAAPEQIEQAPPVPARTLAAPAPPPPEFRARQPRQVARPTTKASELSRRQARIAGNVSAGSPAPAPPAPPAPVAMAAAPAPEADASLSFTPDPRERESHRDGYSTRAVAADSSAPSAGGIAAKPQAEALAEAKAARAVTYSRQKENASLDRVEVTGSRLKRTDLQVPVSDDAHLPVNEWLERVRTRYGLGDAGAAKQSLLLFVKD
ncbi:MAG: hypothetical protein ACREO0_06390, partial [Pseudoxanthomonas sp.]